MRRRRQKPVIGEEILKLQWEIKSDIRKEKTKERGRKCGLPEFLHKMILSKGSLHSAPNASAAMGTQTQHSLFFTLTTLQTEVICRSHLHLRQPASLSTLQYSHGHKDHKLLDHPHFLNDQWEICFVSKQLLSPFHRILLDTLSLNCLSHSNDQSLSARRW